MEANPFHRILLHLIGGLAAAIFYISCKSVKKWKWETFWITGGFFSRIPAPWFFAQFPHDYRRSERAAAVISFQDKGHNDDTIRLQDETQTRF